MMASHLGFALWLFIPRALLPQTYFLNLAIHSNAFGPPLYLTICLHEKVAHLVTAACSS